jgi:3-hydroxyisobutyrate dehydrogenase-like beta-hydroxyacid dehydrogenase
MTQQTSAVGLCGLGNMGLAVAKRLASVHKVLAFDLSEERKAIASAVDGVLTVDSLEAFGEVDTVVLSLPTPAISKAVCGQLTQVLAHKALIIETSTTTPQDVRDCAALVSRAGLSLLDAAILSGVSQMEQGEATLLVGGAESDIRSAAGVLDVLGRQVQVFGELGTGMAAKVVNNAVAHAVMVVLVEAMAMSAASGVDMHKIASMLEAPDGGLIRPLTHRVMERIAGGNFDGGMPLEAARKDSTLALDLAQQHGVPLFAIQGAHTVYEIAVKEGLRREDYSTLAVLWERWIDRSLAYGINP